MKIELNRKTAEELKEIEIVEEIKDLMKKLTFSEKMYLLGKAEGMVFMKELDNKVKGGE